MVTSHHHGTTQLHGTLLLMENYGNYGNQETDRLTRQLIDKRFVNHYDDIFADVSLCYSSANKIMIGG